MVAEMERQFIRECQQAGIEAAKDKGVYGCGPLGRAPPPSPRLSASRG